MKKLISIILAALLALSTLTAAFAATYTDKDTVKKVQQALNDAGYNCGTPDGIAGKKTAAAITQYRTDKGLEVSDTIDDTLLEAMGIVVKAPEAAAEESEQSTEPTDTTPSEDADATAEVGLHDPQALALYYNLALLSRLQALGIDVENEDIGQSAYLITGIESFDGYYFKTDAFTVYYSPLEEEFEMYFEEKAEEKSFLDHAALFAFLFTAKSFYESSDEDWNNVLAQLGDAPARDGTVPALSLNYECKDYIIESGEYYCHARRPRNYKADSYVTGDEVPAIPEDVVAIMGGLPDTIDENWPQYDMFQEANNNVSTRHTGGFIISFWMEADDTIAVKLILMNKEYLHQSWLAHYDKTGKLIDKGYLEY